jgi:hydroxypyruvate isomerase
MALKGRLKQGVTRGCFGRNSGLTLDGMAREAAAMGAKGFDLIQYADWPVLKKNGLVPTMVAGAGTIAEGCNRKENHEKLEEQFRANIQRAAEAGCPNVITFSGNRRGISDEEGLENSAIILKKVAPMAEDKGVNICMELLNSKVDHKDYQNDHTAWGAALCKRVGSPRMKLLYDIYHMQIMEGDVIRNIREFYPYIGHFHTAGNPGRHEITAEQELNYKAIVTAILDLGYTGYLVHEYSPVREWRKSLEEAFAICDL